MTSGGSADSVATSTGVVVVIDDDADMRAALASLFRSVGLPVVLFGSTAEFLDGERISTPGCLVLDIRLPGLSGLDFQTQLTKLSVNMPVIFITGHGDVPMTVRAMKAGAVDFLTKPFRDQDLLDAVYAALETDRKRWAAEQSAAGLLAAYETLTPREKEVMPFVIKGLLNKQIAGEMGLSEITVKIHRSNLMRKLGTKSVADLVRASIELSAINQSR